MVLAAQAVGKIRSVDAATRLEQAVLFGLRLRLCSGFASSRRSRSGRVEPRLAGCVDKPDRHLGTLRRLGSPLDGQPLRRGHQREATLENPFKGIRVKKTGCRIKRPTAAVELNVDLLVEPGFEAGQLGPDFGKTALGRPEPGTKVGDPKRRGRKAALKSPLQTGNGKIDRLCASFDHLRRVEQPAFSRPEKLRCGGKPLQSQRRRPNRTA